MVIRSTSFIFRVCREHRRPVSLNFLPPLHFVRVFFQDGALKSLSPSGQGCSEFLGARAEWQQSARVFQGAPANLSLAVGVGGPGLSPTQQLSQGLCSLLGPIKGRKRDGERSNPEMSSSLNVRARRARGEASEDSFLSAGGLVGAGNCETGGRRKQAWEEPL